jgi:hypothetical protein
MDTNRMELSMDELAMENGGRDLSEKIMGVVKCAECGAATGAIAGGGIGSVVPVIGTGVGAAVGATVGGVAGGIGAAIKLFFLDD